MSSMMNKLAGVTLIVSGLLLVTLMIIGVYLVYGYFGMKNDFAMRQRKPVKAQIEEGSVVTPGSISEIKNSSCLKTRRTRVFWWVDIPTQKKRYLCEWRYGFAGFKKGDEILLIINASKGEVPSKVKEYIISKQGEKMAKAAAVKTINIEEINDRVD
jgi:hypothetical protein